MRTGSNIEVFPLYNTVQSEDKTAVMVVSISETSVGFCETTWRSVPEDAV